MNEQNNFYLNIPKTYDENLVHWNGRRFDRFYLKCGEALKQTVEERTKQEGANTAGLQTLYKFYLPIDVLKKQYNEENRSSHFDSLIFGHQDIKARYDETIFGFSRSKKFAALPISKPERYGCEYVNFADDFNRWLDDNPEQRSQINKNSDKYSLILSIAQNYLEEMMPQYLNGFTAKFLNCQANKSQFRFRDYQKKVYDTLVELLLNRTTNITAELPPRWGKTKTMLKLFADCKTARVLVVLSYVKSVNKSYKLAIYDTDFGEKLQIIEANDANDDISQLDKHLKTVILMNTTGSHCTAKSRNKCLNTILGKLNAKKHVDVMYVIEEADFGNTTELSAQKIRENFHLKDSSFILSITGTEADKMDHVFPNAYHICVNLNDWNEVKCLGTNQTIEIPVNAQ